MNEVDESRPKLCGKITSTVGHPYIKEPFYVCGVGGVPLEKEGDIPLKCDSCPKGNPGGLDSRFCLATDEN